MEQMLNISYRKIGGIRFVKLGRINVQLSVSKKPVAVTADRLAQIENAKRETCAAIERAAIEANVTAAILNCENALEAWRAERAANWARYCEGRGNGGW